MPFPPALVRAASNAADDVAMQHAVHEGYMRLIQGLARAVEFGWAGFKQQAYFSGVSINGPLALGGPGCLRGPEPQIASAPAVAAWIGWEKSILHAFADGFQKAWSEWQRQLIVPSLPWYPPFATWPGPQATPMANVPTPLAACPSAGLAALSAPALAARLREKLQGKLDHPAALADAMAAMIAPAFLTWLGAQMVTQVFGHGPVPGFAPPHAPVGPVVGGEVMPNPGCLAT